MNKSGTVYIGKKSAKRKVQKRVRKQPVQKKAKTAKTTAQSPVSDTESVNFFQISSVFPFQIFPDKLEMDDDGATVVRNWFLFQRRFPMLYVDIQTVRISHGILFSSLEFEVKGYERNPKPVTHLWHSDASRAEQYILEMIKEKRDIDEEKQTENAQRIPQSNIKRIKSKKRV